MKTPLKLLLRLTLALSLTLPAAQANTAPVYDEQKTNILATANRPEFTIKLKSNPTTGYSWFLRQYNARYLEPVKHSFQAPDNKKLMGAPGHELWTFKLKPEAFTVPLQTTVHFAYVRPWEKNQQTPETVFWVSTERKDGK